MILLITDQINSHCCTSHLKVRTGQGWLFKQNEYQSLIVQLERMWCYVKLRITPAFNTYSFVCGYAIADLRLQQHDLWSNNSKTIFNVDFLQLTHWQSPHMHAYFPATISYPALMGDMLADAINSISFTWVRKLFQVIRLAQ